MADFKPNSHRFKEQQRDSEERKIDKVVQGVATTKKKSEISKIASSFLIKRKDPLVSNGSFALLFTWRSPG